MYHASTVHCSKPFVGWIVFCKWTDELQNGTIMCSIRQRHCKRYYLNERGIRVDLEPEFNCGYCITVPGVLNCHLSSVTKYKIHFEFGSKPYLLDYEYSFTECH